MTTRGRPPLNNLTAEEKAEKSKLYQREYQRKRYQENNEASKQIQNTRRYLRDLKEEFPDRAEALQSDYNRLKGNFKPFYELKLLLERLPHELIEEALENRPK
jgi:hypothetical protein